MTRRLPPARWLVLLAALSASSTAMCAKSGGERPAGAQAASYTTNGVVKSIDTAQKGILIAHEDIPGYMKAMTMLFDLRDVEQVKGIAAGDKVTFTFSDENNGKLVIQAIRKTAP